MLSLHQRDTTDFDYVSVDYFSGEWHISISHGYKFSYLVSIKPITTTTKANFESKLFLFRVRGICRAMETRLNNVLHFDSKCCVNCMSVFLNCLVQTYLLTVVINNQMNSVLSVLQSIIYKVHSLSTDLNKKYVQLFKNCK